MKAIIDWPGGLDQQPLIYPLGETEEETEEIRRLLKELFENVNN